VRRTGCQVDETGRAHVRHKLFDGGEEVKGSQQRSLVAIFGDEPKAPCRLHDDLLQVLAAPNLPIATVPIGRRKRGICTTCVTWGTRLEKD